ncbi:MAG: hypothetical protein GIW99_04720 [Candidatus Eremiobacteraeota bacterium]|nr:hypothetical protein [Candidatus Eremiobacteraeota bacterium]MBC5826968.1 hypothetical protein [Candidatus Eremiobacteraeota bacterium]
MTGKKRMERVGLALLIGLVLAAALFYIPLPYYVFGPGAAVDLNEAISVAGHRPPPGAMYLTDVNVMPGRPAFYAVARMLPGYEILPRKDVVPPSTSDREFSRQLGDAMQESQQTAAAVAERAAGLRVKTRTFFTVLAAVKGSPGDRCFRPLDEIDRIEGRSVRDQSYLRRATDRKPAGTSFTVGLVRDGKQLAVRCRTYRYQGKPRFGISVRYGSQTLALPVAVTYRLPRINGSSGGLMFALQIYRTLTGRSLGGERDIAGTGVIEDDGSIAPIEGAREKFRAAVKAGATVFLVPQQNYADIRGAPGAAILPVKSFRDGVRALAALPRRTVAR